MDNHQSANNKQSITVESCFDLYREQVKPLIVEIESIAQKFPEQVLKELRDAFDHLSLSYRFSKNKSKEDCQNEVESAYRHCERAALDGYKILFVFYHDEIQKHLTKWENSNSEKYQDFSLLESQKKFNDAKKSYKEAKLSEATTTNYDALAKHENTHSLFVELKDYVVDNWEKAEHYWQQLNQFKNLISEEKTKIEKHRNQWIGIHEKVSGISWFKEIETKFGEAEKAFSEAKKSKINAHLKPDVVISRYDSALTAYVSVTEYINTNSENINRDLQRIKRHSWKSMVIPIIITVVLTGLVTGSITLFLQSFFPSPVQIEHSTQQVHDLP